MKENLPSPYDAVLGGNSPPPINAPVLGGLEGIKWRLKLNSHKSRRAAIEETLKYGEQGKQFLANIIQTEATTLLWTAYNCLYQNTDRIEKNKLINYSPIVTLNSLKQWGMKQKIGRGLIINTVHLSEELILIIYSSGAVLFNFDRSQILWELDCPTQCCAISSDLTLLALAWRTNIYLWDLPHQKLLHSLKVDRGWIEEIIFSPNNRSIAVKVSSDRTITLWQNLESNISENSTEQSIEEIADFMEVRENKNDAFTSVFLQKLQGHTASVKSIAFSSDNNLIASGSWHDEIIWWNTISGEQIDKIALQTDDRQILGETIAFNRDRGLIASAKCDRLGGNDVIELWDVESKKSLRSLWGHQDRITQIVFSDDNRSMITASKDKTIRRWNLSSGELLQTLQGHHQSVDRLSFSFDRQYLISSSKDNTIRWWDLQSTQPIRSIDRKIDSISNLALNRHRHILATTDDRQSVSLWDLSSGNLLQVLPQHNDRICTIAFSPDGKLLATGSLHASIQLWDLDHNKTDLPKHIFSRHTSKISDLAFSPNGKIMASSSWDGTVRLWSINYEMPLKTLRGHKGCVRTIAFSPDGKSIASGGWDRKIRIWDVISGKQLEEISIYRDILSLAFSPDGKFLVSGSWDYLGSGSTLRLWDVRSGKETESWLNYTRSVHSIAFSPDGRLLVTGGGDMTIRLWDISAGIQLKMLQGHTRSIKTVVFSGNGELLVSGSWDRCVRFWQIEKNRDASSDSNSED